MHLQTTPQATLQQTADLITLATDVIKRNPGNYTNNLMATVTPPLKMGEQLNKSCQVSHPIRGNSATTELHL
jgi:hypothetical protein